MATELDPNAPWLVLAPHLRYPARNGSDISLDRMARCLSALVGRVDLVAESFVVTFEAGSETSRRPFANEMRGKRLAGLLTLLRNSHFYLEKFVTPRFRGKAEELLRTIPYGAVLYSYLTTTTATSGVRAEDLPSTRMVWTHNDEFKWFHDLADSTEGMLGRRVARCSERWLRRFGSEVGRYLLLHVTESDRDGYESEYPSHRYAVVPIGVDLPAVEPEALVSNSLPVRLTFVGSLGVRMNLDALTYFRERYFPSIREAFGDHVEVHVAGSLPSAGVMALCRTQGWTLHADLPDAWLDAVIDASTFSILPFNYATGAKLKLLKSMAHGIPFLATTRVSAQAALCLHPSLISDDPDAWVTRIRDVVRDGISASERAAQQSIAQQHSWETSVRILYDALHAEQVRPAP